MGTEKPTDRQTYLLESALGVGGKYTATSPWRSYFCTGPSGRIDREWAQMVERGWARLVGQPEQLMPYNTYCVTEAGAELLGVKLPEHPVKAPAPDPQPPKPEKIDTGGYAHPSESTHHEHYSVARRAQLQQAGIEVPQSSSLTVNHPGMTLLDYFAGQIIGHLAEGVYNARTYRERPTIAELGLSSLEDRERAEKSTEMAAQVAYDLAAAMVKRKRELEADEGARNSEK